MESEVPNIAVPGDVKRYWRKIKRKNMQKKQMKKSRKSKIETPQSIYERRVLTLVPVIPAEEPAAEPAAEPAEQEQPRSGSRSPTPPAPGDGEGFIELNSSNAATFVSNHSDTLFRGSSSQWHQITIKTPVLESKRKFAILAINKQLASLKLTPYFFQMENGRIKFYVNACDLALKALCKRDLKVPYISDKFVEIEMTVKLFAKTFDVSEVLKEIVSRRLDSQNKFLDLSDINSIPEVQEMLFHPSDNWHLVEQLLRLAEAAAPRLAALGLAGNRILTPTPLWEFLVRSKWRQSLRTLDLSDNEIQNIATLPQTRTLKLTELYLDRNPICKVISIGNYVRVIRATFPYLAKLDGTYAITTVLPLWKPNFIASSTDDSGEFADQFVEHFFTLYDGADRTKLCGLYHKNACFSLSCLRLDPYLTTSNSRLTAYTAASRNLLHCSDTKKARATLTRGAQNILKRLASLPVTQHDSYSFTVDLTVRTSKMTVLTVTGVFRDSTEEKSTHRHFSRTFVLAGQGNCKYQITNDILYISNPTTREVEESFKFERPPTKMKKYEAMPLSKFEKDSMTRVVQQLTCMTAPWSQKCLEDTDWDLKEALQIFLELYETSKIPKAAFEEW